MQHHKYSFASTLFVLAAAISLTLLGVEAQSAGSNVSSPSFPPSGLALWWNPSSWIIDTVNQDDSSTAQVLKVAVDQAIHTAAGAEMSDSSFVGVPVTKPGLLVAPQVSAIDASAVNASDHSFIRFNSQSPSTLQIQSEGRIHAPAWYDSHTFIALSINSSCVSSGGCVILSHRALDDAITNSFTAPSLSLYVDSTSTLSLTVRYPIRSANETYSSAAQITPTPVQETTVRLPSPLPLNTNVILHLSLHTVLPPPPIVQTITTVTNVSRTVYVTTEDDGTMAQQVIDQVVDTKRVTVISPELIQTDLTLEAWIPGDSTAPVRVLRASSPLTAGADLRGLSDSASFVGGFGVSNQLASSHPILSSLKPFSGSVFELQVYVAQMQANAITSLSTAEATSVGDVLASIWLRSMARPSVASPANTQPSSSIVSNLEPEFLVPIVNDTGVVRTPSGLSYLPRSEQEALRVTFNFVTLNLTDTNAAVMGLLNDIRALLGLSMNSTALQFVTIDVARQIPVIDFVPALDSPSPVNSPYRAVMKLADALDSGEGYANPRYEYLAQLSRDRELRVSFTSRDDDDSSNDSLRRKLLIGILVPTLSLIVILCAVAFVLYGRNGELRVALQKRIMEFTKRTAELEPVMTGTTGLEADDPRRFQLESLQLHRCKGCRLLQCADTVPLQDADPLEVSKANIDVGELRQRHRAQVQQAVRESSMMMGSSLHLDVAENWSSNPSPQRPEASPSSIARYQLSPKNGQPLEMGVIPRGVASPRSVKSPSNTEADRPPWGWRSQPSLPPTVAEVETSQPSTAVRFHVEGGEQPQESSDIKP